MVSKERPPAVRQKERKQADALYQKAKRHADGATPHDMSVAARHRRGEFGAVSLKTVRRQIADGKIDLTQGVEMPANDHVSSDVHFSSATALACRVEDEKGTRPVSAENAASLEIDQIEREPLTARFRLIKADYQRGPAPSATPRPPYCAKVVAFRLDRAA